MKEYSLSPDADEDLREIWNHLAVKNRKAANSLLLEFYNAFDLIAANPDMGRRYDERYPGLQVFVSDKYHIFYRVTNDDAQIKRIIHGARDLTKIVFE